MKRTLWVAAVMLVVSGGPAWAQQDEIARLKAELQKQQEMIARLIQQVEALEKKQAEAVTREELDEEAQTQSEAVSSVRDSLLGRVNLNGYYNFRFSADDSATPVAFQQHHLGVILGKQLGRFSVLTELELQNVPHHAEIRREGEAGEGLEGAEKGEPHAEGTEGDISGEGQVAVENAWMEYSHSRFVNVRVGKQLSPQYWWQNRYPNLTLSTDLPIHLRELFPPELVGVMVHGSAASPVGASEFGLGYRFYISNNQFEGNSRTDRRDGKSWGGRLQLRFPTAGRLRRLDVAADLYRGQVGLVTQELVADNVFGFEGQLEVDRFLFQGEYARGRTLGTTRFGYYLQPAVRLHDEWVTFYRAERLESPLSHRAEMRHLAGLNFRPFPQIAIKGEYYRALPLGRSYIESEEALRRVNGFAAAAVFFF
jgi:hypothetical protein